MKILVTPENLSFLKLRIVDGKVFIDYGKPEIEVIIQQPVEPYPSPQELAENWFPKEKVESINILELADSIFEKQSLTQQELDILLQLPPNQVLHKIHNESWISSYLEALPSLSCFHDSYLKKYELTKLINSHPKFKYNDQIHCYCKI